MRRSALLLAVALVALGTTTPCVAATQGAPLFEEGCSSCHGLSGGGIPGRGPSLHGVGAAAVDFYLSTGRMPLDDPNAEPLRTEPVYTPAEIRALIAHVESLSPARGEPIPDVDLELGNLSDGLRAFTAYCAGCHQVLGRGGIVVDAFAPSLVDSTPTQVAEAIRVGPHLMPPFGEQMIDERTLDSIVRYVEWSKHPPDEGGWAIGHVGPVPEGLLAWLLGVAALVAVARFLGERAE